MGHTRILQYSLLPRTFMRAEWWKRIRLYQMKELEAEYRLHFLEFQGWRKKIGKMLSCTENMPKIICCLILVWKDYLYREHALCLNYEYPIRVGVEREGDRRLQLNMLSWITGNGLYSILVLQKQHSPQVRPNSKYCR